MFSHKMSNKKTLYYATTKTNRKIDWTGLFPRRPAVAIFISYVSLNIIQGILATLDHSDSIVYNVTTVLLLIEMMKLTIATILFIYKNSVEAFANGLAENKYLLRLYCVPAILYCAYYNLVLSNSTSLELPVHFLLLQIRIPVTALIFQIVFRKYLTSRQWISLLLLTVGNMLRQFQFSELQSNLGASDFAKSAAFVLVPVTLLALATVCHEHFLKHRGDHVDVHLQNVFLSLHQVILQMAMLVLASIVEPDEFTSDLSDIYVIVNDPYLLLMMLINAVLGLVGAFFLRYMNTITRVYGSALEILVGPLSGYVMFSWPVYASTSVAVALVSAASYVYAVQPIVNNGPGIKGHSRTWRLLNDDWQVQRI